MNVPAVCICPAPILAAYSYGIFSGVVVEIGAFQTSVVPIINGSVCASFVSRVAYISGNVQTQMLSMYLSSDKHALPMSLRLPFAAKDRDHLARQVRVGQSMFAPTLHPSQEYISAHMSLCGLLLYRSRNA